MQLASAASETLALPQSELGANEMVFEIRYLPNSRILDHRGEWARVLAKELSLPEWTIIENRIDLFTPQKDRRAFVSFRNAGLNILDAPTREYFPDQVGKLMRKLAGFPDFGMPLSAGRLGVRARFATPFDGSFEELAGRFATRYVGITAAAKEAIGAGATLMDVGAPLNFKDKLGFFNTMSGPMKRDEFARFFTKDEPFPDVGLFYDIDYWKVPDAPLTERDVSITVAAFIQAGWERAERVRKLILE